MKGCLHFTMGYLQKTSSLTDLFKSFPTSIPTSIWMALIQPKESLSKFVQCSRYGIQLFIDPPTPGSQTLLPVASPLGTRNGNNLELGLTSLK